MTLTLPNHPPRHSKINLTGLFVNTPKLYIIAQKHHKIFNMSSKEENDDDEIEQDETNEPSKRTNQEKRAIQAVHLFAAYATYFTIQNTTKISTFTDSDDIEKINQSDKKLLKKHLEKYYEIYKKNIFFNYNIDTNYLKLPPNYTRINDLNKLYYIFIKINNDNNFRNLIAHQINFKTTIKENIVLQDKEIRLGEKTFMYSGTQCIHCNNSLKINAIFGPGKQSQARKGRIAIAYSDHAPPTICTSYIKKCENCNISYSYGIIRNKTSGHIMRLNLKERDYFEVSPETYIHKNLFTYMTASVIQGSQSIENFVHAQNQRWETEKTRILLQTDQLGRRSVLDLDYNRVIHSFYMYHFQRYLKDYINKDVSLSKDDLNEIEKRKKSKPKHKKQPGTSNNASNKNVSSTNTSNNVLNKNVSRTNTSNIALAPNVTSTENDDETKLIKSMTLCGSEEFKFLWHKYKNEITNGPIPYIKTVPIKDNTYHHGHFIVYGDGNQKIKRWRCSMPQSIIQYLILINNNSNSNNNYTTKTQTYDKKIYKIKHNNFCCSHSPISGAKDTDGFMTCNDHTNILIEHPQFEIKKENINEFIQWYHITDKIDKINKINISGQNEEKTVRRAILLSRWTTLLNKIDKKDEKKWVEIRNKINKALQPLPINNYSRNNRSKTNANINESIEMENDDTFLTNLENTLEESNINPGILSTVASQSRDTFNDNIEISQNLVYIAEKGCRKETAMRSATGCQINGVNAFFTCSGFCISLKEELYRETPTQIVLETPKLFTSHKDSIKYYERIAAFGYDMACNILKTLIALSEEDALTDEQKKFWKPIMNRLFIDAFHISSHRLSICKEDSKEGILHPKLKKFKDILTGLPKKKKINHQIVEQFWKELNKQLYMKALSEEKFAFFLILKREYHNKKQKEKLEKKGYTFIEIDNITVLRSFNASEVPTKLLTIDQLRQSNAIPLSKPVLNSNLMIVPRQQSHKKIINTLHTLPSYPLSQSSINAVFQLAEKNINKNENKPNKKKQINNQKNAHNNNKKKNQSKRKKNQNKQIKNKKKRTKNQNKQTKNPKKRIQEAPHRNAKRRRMNKNK